MRQPGTLGIEEFGRQLIQSGDLDPVYIAAAGADMPIDQRSRWLLAYWCFYHTGAASWLSEQKGSDFWKWMRYAAMNGEIQTPLLSRWPRASERRYFRGPKCVRAVEWLNWHCNSDPCYLVDRLRWKSTHTEIMAEVQKWPLFGPWIAFKVADMMEAVDGAMITFSDDILTFYASPREGLELAARLSGRSVLDERDHLLDHFSQYKSPPRYKEDCGVAVVETVSCKFVSHRAGRYTVGKDILEVRHALKGWGATAERLLAACPKEVAT